MVVQLQRQPAAAAAAPRAQVQLRAATWRMCAVQALLACAALAAAAPPQQQQQQCSQPRQGEPGAITDLTVPVRAGLPVWEQAAGLRRNWRALSQSQEEGEVVNQVCALRPPCPSLCTRLNYRLGGAVAALTCTKPFQLQCSSQSASYTPNIQGSLSTTESLLL